MSSHGVTGFPRERDIGLYDWELNLVIYGDLNVILWLGGVKRGRHRNSEALSCHALLGHTGDSFKSSECQRSTVPNKQEE